MTVDMKRDYVCKHSARHLINGLSLNFYIDFHIIINHSLFSHYQVKYKRRDVFVMFLKVMNFLPWVTGYPMMPFLFHSLSYSLP